MHEHRSTVRTARLAGGLYLAMAPFAAYSLYVRFGAFVHDDAAATAGNITANAAQHLGAIATWLTSQTLWLFLVLALYRLLRPVDKQYAMAMIVLSLVGIPISMLNEINQFAPLLLLSGAEFSSAFDTMQLQSLAVFFLHLHERGLQIAHVFWGLWLFPLGILLIKSGFLPKALGVLLIVAGSGYLIDLTTYFVFPGRATTVTQFTFIGELLLPLWLVTKGVNVERWNQRASAA